MNFEVECKSNSISEIIWGKSVKFYRWASNECSTANRASYSNNLDPGIFRNWYMVSAVIFYSCVHRNVGDHNAFFHTWKCIIIRVWWVCFKIQKLHFNVIIICAWSHSLLNWGFNTSLFILGRIVKPRKCLNTENETERKRQEEDSDI